MSPQTSELERILQQLIRSHRSLIDAMQAHQTAMREMNLGDLERAGRDQEAIRQRIVRLEQERIAATSRRAMELRLPGSVTLGELAEADLQQGQKLAALRKELKRLIAEASRRSQITTRLAGAILGHLNTAMRLMGGAMAQAGVYTRGGSRPLAGRIGIMEAVG